jgi:hypothetical protein
VRAVLGVGHGPGDSCGERKLVDRYEGDGPTYPILTSDETSAFDKVVLFPDRYSRTSD